jgi:DNA polymerase/3'-5' exonuclease PolX
MEISLESPSNPPGSRALSNAEIADCLSSLAQLLPTQKENPYKIEAYMRAAAKIRTFSESVDDPLHPRRIPGSA